MKKIVILLMFTISTCSGCKLGEVDVNTPTSMTCTADGWQVNDQGALIVDSQGLALDCTAQ